MSYRSHVTYNVIHLFDDIADAVTNPIDVIKIRMQLDQELTSRGHVVETLKGRYYRGMVHGAVMVVRDEGIRGIYKGYVQITSDMMLYSIVAI